MLFPIAILCITIFIHFLCSSPILLVLTGIPIPISHIFVCNCTHCIHTVSLSPSFLTFWVTLSYINPTFPFFSSIFGMQKGPDANRAGLVRVARDPLVQRGHRPLWWWHFGGRGAEKMVGFTLKKWGKTGWTSGFHHISPMKKWCVWPHFTQKNSQVLLGCQRQNDGFLPWCRWNPFGTTSSWQLRSREVTGPAYGRGPRQWPTLGISRKRCDWMRLKGRRFDTFLGSMELETSKFKDFQPMGFSRCLTYWPLLTSSGVRFDVFFLGVIPSPPTMTSESWGSGSRHVTTLSALVFATLGYRGLSWLINDQSTFYMAYHWTISNRYVLSCCWLEWPPIVW